MQRNIKISDYIKRIFCLLLLLISVQLVAAQELNSKVQIIAPNVSNINKQNLQALQNVMRDFLNNNKWTNDTYLPQERIECNFVITITSWDGSSGYTAEAQIQSNRPVYGSSYYSTLLNISDKDFDFFYNEGQSLDFSEQNFINNLSSLLGFYAYTIIGLDKDSFAMWGGTPLYLKAQAVLNVAQNGGNKGWKAFDGLRNRYWLNENLLNTSLKELRSFIYNYHVNGMDRLQENAGLGTKNILGQLASLQQLDRIKLNSFFPNVYFASKADEVSNVLNMMPDPGEKINAYNLLSQIDPANVGKYDLLKKRN